MRLQRLNITFQCSVTQPPNFTGVMTPTPSGKYKMEDRRPDVVVYNRYQVVFVVSSRRRMHYMVM